MPRRLQNSTSRRARPYSIRTRSPPPRSSTAERLSFTMLFSTLLSHALMSGSSSVGGKVASGKIPGQRLRAGVAVGHDDGAALIARPPDQFGQSGTLAPE